MGPGFFLFFRAQQAETGGAAYDPLLEWKRREHFRRKKLEEYEKELKDKLDKKRAESLNEQKALKKEEIKLNVEVLLADQQDIRQKQKVELELAQVSESLLTIEKDLAEIKQLRETIKERARIMRNNDEVLILLISEGYL